MPSYTKNLTEFRIHVFNFIQNVRILLVEVILNVSCEPVLRVPHPIGKNLDSLRFDAHAFTTMNSLMVGIKKLPPNDVLGKKKGGLIASP